MVCNSQAINVANCSALKTAAIMHLLVFNVKKMVLRPKNADLRPFPKTVPRLQKERLPMKSCNKR